MIKVNELRIGNRIIWNGYDERIKTLLVESIENDISTTRCIINEVFLLHHCIGIPLTTEILEKCGLGDCVDFGAKWTYIKNEDGAYYLICDFVRVSDRPIKYLHQLQNLHFAITGEEIEINL